MGGPKDAFRAFLARIFLPGAVYTFIGAGGKTAGIRCVWHWCCATGLKVRITTTTKVTLYDFSGCPVSVAATPEELWQSVLDPAPARLIIAGEIPGQEKYKGLDPLLIDASPSRADTVILVEGDGSRGLPLKAPAGHEPVIPSKTTMVLAVMGARGFDEPITPELWYNHDAALRVLGRTESFFQEEEVARLAGHDEGCRKGVLPGVGFALVINQGDVVEKRQTASRALRLLRERQGIVGVLLSWQKEELYDSTID